MELVPLHPVFGVEIRGVDVAGPLDDATFAGIRRALDDHALLLFRDQHLDDAKQIAFSERFGPLEKTISANPAAGTPFARQSNLDIATGAVIPPEDKRMVYQLANYIWHSDSSYKRVPSLCSMLTGRIVPPEGGNTEFADMRAAYDALSEEMKQKVDGLITEHAFAHSRARVDPTLLDGMIRPGEAPPVQQVLVRINPVTGRKSLYIGSHCHHVIGWPLDEGTRFIEMLTATAIKPDFVYSHAWREGDVVIWDNRSLLHRATTYDNQRYKRLMQRTTISGDLPTVAR